MGISGFSRIDTVTVPDKFMAVASVSDAGDMNPQEIRDVLEQDKESLDYLGVRSDSDPLSIADLYKTIKAIKPRGMKVMLISDGRSPDILDDLVGAGYVHAMDILIGKELSPEQRQCIEILLDNKCKYAVTVVAADHDADSIARIADLCEKCSMFILKSDRNRPVTKGDLSALTASAKRCTWNVRTA